MIGKRTIFSLTLALSTLAITSSAQAGNQQPTTSQMSPSETAPSTHSSPSPDSAQTNRNSWDSSTSIKQQIPQSAAIVAGVPRTIEFNASQEQGYPISLQLLQPLRNSKGQVAISKNAVISAQIQPTETGARLVTESIIVQGRTIPVKATSQTIPGREVKVKDRFQEAKQKQQTFGRLGHSVVGVVGGGSGQSQKMGGLVGSAVGLVSGMTSSDEIQLVAIQQGSTFVLTLDEAIELPPMSASAPSQPRNSVAN